MTDSGKHGNTHNAPSATTSDFKFEDHHEILQELKQACQNAAARFVSLHVPHGSMLSPLLDLVVKLGLSLVDHWDEDDIPVDFDSDHEFEDEE